VGWRCERWDGGAFRVFRVVVLIRFIRVLMKC
jgi:hypothetical protein